MGGVRAERSGGLGVWRQLTWRGHGPPLGGGAVAGRPAGGQPDPGPQPAGVPPRSPVRSPRHRPTRSPCGFGHRAAPGRGGLGRPMPAQKNPLGRRGVRFGGGGQLRGGPGPGPASTPARRVEDRVRRAGRVGEWAWRAQGGPGRAGARVLSLTCEKKDRMGGESARSRLSLLCARSLTLPVFRHAHTHSLPMAPPPSSKPKGAATFALVLLLDWLSYVRGCVCRTGHRERALAVRGGGGGGARLACGRANRVPPEDGRARPPRRLASLPAWPWFRRRWPCVPEV